MQNPNHIVLALLLSGLTPYLKAQDVDWQPQSIILQSEQKTVRIPVGDWVVAVDASGQILATGKLVGLYGTDLVLLPTNPLKKRAKYANGYAPTAEIASIYHGEYGRAGAIGGQLFGGGFSTGLKLGPLLMVLVNLSRGRTFQAEKPMELFMIVGFMSGVFAMTMGPVAGIAGLLEGASRSGHAVKYDIGTEGPFSLKRMNQ